MTPDLEQKLYDKFPELFRARTKSSQESSMCWGIDCEDKWFELLWEHCLALEAQAEKEGLDRNSEDWPEAVQVKWKIDSIRFHLRKGSEAMHALREQLLEKTLSINSNEQKDLQLFSWLSENGVTEEFTILAKIITVSSFYAGETFQEGNTVTLGGYEITTECEAFSCFGNFRMGGYTTTEDKTKHDALMARLTPDSLWFMTGHLEVTKDGLRLIGANFRCILDEYVILASRMFGSLRSKDYKAFQQNRNVIFTKEWSNLEAQKLYDSQFSQRPDLASKRGQGKDCSTCKHFRFFNLDWGLCNNSHSPFYLCTVFEHFICEKFQTADVSTSELG